MVRRKLDGLGLKTQESTYLGNFRPYNHQIKTDELVKSSNEFFAINASPTGGGKTLSWLKPSIEGCINTIAVYPTNALIQEHGPKS